MNQSPTIGAIAAALSKAQASFKPAIKDANNPFFKSKYCDLAGALDACRDSLSANGLAIVQSTEAGDKMVLHTTLIHASGEWISSTYPINPQKTDPQGIGSAVTYARRYSLMALVGLAAEDDDGEAAHGRKHETSTPTPVVTQSPAAASIKTAIARVGKEKALQVASDAAGVPITKAADIPANKSAAVIAAMDALCNG